MPVSVLVCPCQKKQTCIIYFFSNNMKYMSVIVSVCPCLSVSKKNKIQINMDYNKYLKILIQLYLKKNAKTVKLLPNPQHPLQFVQILDVILFF